MLQTACGDITLYTVNAEDSVNGEASTLYQTDSRRNHTGGLLYVLNVKVGAVVMLTVNLDVSTGLVNGAIGVIRSVLMKNGRVEVINVKFHNVSTTHLMCSVLKDDDSNGTVAIR